MRRNKKAVILLSGGIDSAAALYLAKKKGYRLFALLFDYGQKHKKELRCAKNLALLNKVEWKCLKVSLPWSRSSLTSFQKKVPKNPSGRIPSTYVSGRNLIFLSYAASYAESIGAESIFIGAHTLDYSGYPDCRKNFLEAFNQAVNLGIVGKKIKIRYPFIADTKKEIINSGLNLGVPFELTWSCYQGRRKPCLRCDSCRFRNNAFSELGIKDPLLKK